MGSLMLFDNEIGVTLLTWLPEGEAVRSGIREMVNKLWFRAGYRKVVTPQLGRRRLYDNAGTMSPRMMKHYLDDGSEKSTYLLRDSTSQHHHQIYASSPRSWRDLPFRLAESTQTYVMDGADPVVRDECSAHVYCAEGRIEEEAKGALEMCRDLQVLLRLPRDSMRLDGRSGEPVKQPLGDALENRSLGGIEVSHESPSGSRTVLSVLSLDRDQPRRLGLKYVNAHGDVETPVCLHFSIVENLERLIFLLMGVHGKDLNFIQESVLE